MKNFIILIATGLFIMAVSCESPKPATTNNGMDSTRMSVDSARVDSANHR